MGSASVTLRQDPDTTAPADISSSPVRNLKAAASQDSQPVLPPPSPHGAGRVPRWLRLRIKASAPLNRSRWHGPGHVIVLPFNKVAKLNVRVTEIAAMNFVRGNTSIPVPKILEVYHDVKLEGFANIVMTKIPGNDLGDVMDKMSNAELKSIVKELSGYMKQLRRFESDVGGHAPAIGGVGGISGFDTRIASLPFGPFATTTEFHTYIRRKEPIEYWEYEPNVMAVHGKPEGAYRLRLTHGDFAPRNIRIKNGKITGIIDWEFAGWYPEYWEYTRLYYPGEQEGLRRWYNAIEEEGAICKYKPEKKAEEAIWEMLGPFGFE